MSDFYSEWLNTTERNEEFVDNAPRVASHKELEWIKTRQDAKAALMIAPERGFPTGGSMMMRAEIPVGLAYRASQPRRGSHLRRERHRLHGPRRQAL